jgi:hypothetical protein
VSDDALAFGADLVDQFGVRANCWRSVTVQGFV